MTDAAVADRIQFAFTVMFHYLFPITTMGLAPLLVLLTTLHLRTGDDRYGRAAQFWGRIFAINFAAGVVTGIPMEFQFGTNWASFSAFTGSVIGQTLAMEGIFAFFLESGFLAVFLFGAGRVSPVLHWLSSVLLAAGALISGFFITATDAWMQHPVGYRVAHGRVELTSLWALITNPFAYWQYLHVINGAFLAGSMLMASIGAFYLLRGRHTGFGRLSVLIGLTLGTVFSITQIFPTGDMNARNVVHYQPVKQAAYEGLFRSQADAPIAIIGMPSTEQHRLLDPIEVPGLLSFLSYGEAQKTVPGLDRFPTDSWPPVQVTYYAYHIMVGLGTIFLALLGLGVLLAWRRRLFGSPWYLWLLMLALPFPYIANEAGWVVTEVGRQPWLVWGLMPTSRGTSPTVEAGETIFTLLGFAGIYSVLIAGVVFLLGRQIVLGPDRKPAPRRRLVRTR
ncbi:MAG: cytochrome bd ubiquinol oxidase, subunit [Chloroflexi bacterium]|jgi:cytochrome d ubiquinol oxidase subunit I|nr:cytochrome bd ubiquinol oxidase, subunit [Chloroflexota bacterium]